ncbi:hypothetical protein M9H77_34582 [Catharanthus roseus]|uniref:Uncharacterized protein n=1 Tax=Catharanthus roseus TaxID=4058 RepID=A0ACB9ZLK2_CATRO|nr:hypothetical protein M9H77_34582 [Catharanthus roseus]
MTEKLKPKDRQTKKQTPSSGNAASRHRRTPEQREESSGRAEESGRKPRVSKTPKDREWRDGSEEEGKRLHRNRSNNGNKKIRRAVHPWVANGRPGWPTRTARASL